MGKASRNKKRTAEQEALRREQERLLRAANRPRRIAITVVCAVLGVALLAGGCIIGVDIYRKESGESLRSEQAASAEGVSVNNAMATYFFKATYGDYVSKYSDYLKTLGLDTGLSLRQQKCYYDSSITWYDYFMEQTRQKLRRAAAYCSAAKQAGMSLNEAEQANIDNRLALLEQRAADENKSVNAYTASLYGRGISVDDLRDCLELTALSDKYYNDYYNKLDYTDKQVEQEFSDNINEYLTCEYKSYTIKVDMGENPDEANQRAAMAFAKLDADKFENLKSEQEFDIQLTEYLKKVHSQNGNSTISAEELAQEVEGTRITGAKNDGSEFAKWAFSKERSGRSKVIKETDRYMVYYLITEPVKQTYFTKSVRHILYGNDIYGTADAAKAAAQAELAKIKQAADVRAAFIDSAIRNSTDVATSITGGLYPAVKNGEMTAAFNDWCFDSSRRAGDIDLVTTEYGTHLMYFEGTGDRAWYADAKKGLKIAECTKMLEDTEKKNAVTVYDDILSKIDVD